MANVPKQLIRSCIRSKSAIYKYDRKKEDKIHIKQSSIRTVEEEVGFYQHTIGFSFERTFPNLLLTVLILNLKQCINHFCDWQCQACRRFALSQQHIFIYVALFLLSKVDVQSNGYSTNLYITNQFRIQIVLLRHIIIQLLRSNYNQKQHLSTHIIYLLYSNVQCYSLYKL